MLKVLYAVLQDTGLDFYSLRGVFAETRADSR